MCHTDYYIDIKSINTCVLSFVFVTKWCAHLQLKTEYRNNNDVDVDVLAGDGGSFKGRRQWRGLMMDVAAVMVVVVAVELAKLPTISYKCLMTLVSLINIHNANIYRPHNIKL